ncbi:PAS domain-containing protein [Streptomyces sp. NPDC005498]|uniref:sensor histidine kinase n=1 Tax=Streptomyces sp. NPDC005498 TaxID=3364717 RepID=UPI0036B37CDB
MTPVSEELESFLDVIQQPALVVDGDGTVSYANTSAAETLGYDRPADLVGLSCRPAAEHGATGAALPGPGRPGRLSREKGTLLHLDGCLVPAEWLCLPLYRAAALYVLAVTDAPPPPARRSAADPADRRGTPLAPTLAAREYAGRQRHIAETLQHGAQERLATLLLSLNLAQENLGSDDGREAAAGLIADSVKDAEKALDDVRRATAATYPGVLRLRGLPAAVGALAAECPLPVTVTGTMAGRLPEEVEMHLYFMVHAALERAVHGARPGEVRIAIDFGTDLVLSVSDCGGPPDRPVDEATLVTMAARASALGGRLRVVHAPGTGTTIRVVVPRPSSTEHRAGHPSDLSGENVR